MTGTLPEDNRLLANRHHRCGWCALFVFISFGMALDAFHGFKIGSYLDPSIDSPRALQDVDSYNNIRRFLWMLCQRHGTLLALVHLIFAFALQLHLISVNKTIRLASFFLGNSLILLPTGFFLGGFGITETDPGIGIYLVPLGALFLCIAVYLVAQNSLGHSRARVPDSTTNSAEPTDSVLNQSDS